MDRERPIICTLTGAERGARSTTWQDAIATMGPTIEERHDGYLLSAMLDLPMFEKLRDLVQAERECCQWMTLELNGGSPATLRISADSIEGKAAIKTMLGLAS